MEPLNDRNSFGFRPGRNSHQAISYFYDKLCIRTSYFSKNKNISNKKIQKLLNTDKKKYHAPFHLLHANIENCFNKIAYNWLISNVPIPQKYKFLLEHIIKNNKCTVPQKSILSPLLINWILDGLESLVFETVTNIKSKSEKNLNNSNYQIKYSKTGLINLRSTTLIIRYADEFIIGVKNKASLDKIKNQLKLFLKERGLTLSCTKTEIKIFNKNTKLNFLSWTFHRFVPKHVSWIIKNQKKTTNTFIDSAEMHIYPSKISVSIMKNNIKQITNHFNSWKNENLIIKSIIKIIVGWSNYFSPAPKQATLRLAIDWYIFKRIKRYAYKKYGTSYLANYLRLNLNDDNSKKKSISLTSTHQGREYSFFIPSLYDLNTSCMWTEVVPENDFLNSSFLYNPKLYIKRAIKVTTLKKDL